MAENINSGLSGKINILPSFAGFATQFRTGMRGQAPMVVQFARTLGGQFSAAFVAGLGVRAVTRNFAEIVASARSFEDSFTGVRKTVEATDAEFELLAKGIRDLSKELPVAVEEINRIGEVAGQLGISKAGLIDFTETVAKLSATTTMSSEGAAFALARLASIAQLPESSFKMLGGVIVELGNNFATTEDMMTNLALRIVGTGKVVGMSVPDIFAMAAAISQVGVRAELGGTALSRFLVAVQQATRTGGEQLNTLSRVAGMSASEFRKAFEDDAAMAVAAFLAGLNQMKEDGEDVFAVMEKLGLNAVRVRDVLLRSSQAAPEFFKAIDLARAQEGIEDAGNALEVEFQKRVETTTSQLILMDNAINDLKISLGEAFLPAVKSVAEAVAGLTNAYNQGSQSIKLTLFLVRNLGLLLVSSVVGIMSYKAAFTVLKATLSSTTVALGAMSIGVKGLAASFTAALTVLGLIVGKVIQGQIETANFIDAVAELRARMEELSPQQKLDLLEQLLGDNPREKLKLLNDAGVDINNLFEAIENGVNSGDTLKVKAQLAELLMEIDESKTGFLNGVSSIDDFNDAVTRLSGAAALRDPGNKTKLAASQLVLSILESIQENEPLLQAEVEALEQLGKDAGKKVADGLGEGEQTIKNALDFFNDSIKEGLRDGFNAFSDIEPDIEQNIDQFLASLIIKLQRQEDFEQATEELAKRGLAGLVKAFSDEGPSTTNLINEILAADPKLGMFMEMLIAENNPKFFLEVFGSELPPIFSDIEKQFAENGGKIGEAFNSGFQENALSIFGDDSQFFTPDTVPVNIAEQLLNEGNVNMTKDDLITFYKRVFLDSDVQNELDTINKGLAGDFVSEFEKNLSGFDDVMDVISTKISKLSADSSLKNATANLNNLLKEQSEITNNLGDAQARVTELRERDAQRTASEQLRIRDLTRKRDFLAKAVEEGQDATLELAVANEELAQATKDADAPTRDLLEAEQELFNLQERNKTLPDEIAEARIREEQAILRVASAQRELEIIAEDIPSLTQAQIDFFTSIAVSAGIANAQVSSLVTNYGLLSSLNNTTPPAVVTPPTTVTPPDVTGTPNIRNIPMFAKGGFLPIGGSGVVGERGMEIITSTGSGTKITPVDNNISGFGNANVTVNVTGFPTDPIVARNIAENIRKELVRLEEEGRGGLLSR